MFVIVSLFYTQKLTTGDWSVLNKSYITYINKFLIETLRVFIAYFVYPYWLLKDGSRMNLVVAYGNQIFCILKKWLPIAIGYRLNYYYNYRNMTYNLRIYSNNIKSWNYNKNVITMIIHLWFMSCFLNPGQIFMLQD